MSIDAIFSKQTIEIYLKELAKEFKKRGGGTRAEIIIVGGASVIINYGFRASSYDIDATYESPTVMKESINAVADKFGLPDKWLNDDFKKTNSFTHKIIQYSEYYKTFSGVLEIRTVRAEYLVAMKLVSGRRYKNDLSDIVGIIHEQKISGKPLTFETIDKAVVNLYGDWSLISEYSKELLEKILNYPDLKSLLEELSENEASARETLIEIVEKYPKAVNQDNIDDVIAIALNKKKKKI